MSATAVPVLESPSPLPDSQYPNQHLERIFPDTTDDLWMSRLSVADRCRFAKTCKFAREKILSYTRSHFKLHDLLRKYFEEAEILPFRELMATTSMFISGSTALQFFDCVVYQESDLDLYAEHKMAKVIIDWLVQAGYVLVPPDSEDDDQSEDEEDSVDTGTSTNKEDQFIPLKLTRYFGAKKVFSLKKEGGKRVQLITTMCCPLQLLLCFHSSCVMNFITHSRAFSLYPAATFLEKRNLVQPFFHIADQRPAIIKYAGRGWSIVEKLSQEEAFDPHSAFAPGIQYVGDSRSWCIDLLPPINSKVPDFIESHTWAIIYDQYFDVKLDAAVFKSPRLSQGYVVSATSISRKDLVLLFSEIKGRSKNDEMLDIEFASLIQEIRK